MMINNIQSMTPYFQTKLKTFPMKSLQALVIVALGLVFFSSCGKGYGCQYGSLNGNESVPSSIEKVVPEKSTTALDEKSYCAK